MLTLEKMLRLSPPNWLTNSDGCRIKNYKKIIDSEDKNPTVLALVYSIYDSKGNRKDNPIVHRCYIKGIDGKKKKIISSNIECSCDCDAYKYWSEVALHNKEASLILFSNGEDPIEKNPKKIPYGCKHLIRLGLLIQTLGM